MFRVHTILQQFNQYADVIVVEFSHCVTIVPEICGPVDVAEEYPLPMKRLNFARTVDASVRVESVQKEQVRVRINAEDGEILINNFPGLIAQYLLRYQKFSVVNGSI